MAWSDQCKISFAVTVRAKQHRGEKQRSTNAIIKEISGESGIPASTLRNWWADAERGRKLSKNGQHDATHQEQNENTVDQKQEVDQRPTCHCGHPAKLGRVKADGTRSYYRSCSSCLRRATAAAPAPSKKIDVHIKPQARPPVSYAMDFVTTAISHLERIKQDDPQRVEAIQKVLMWIGEHHLDAVEAMEA